MAKRIDVMLMVGSVVDSKTHYKEALEKINNTLATTFTASEIGINGRTLSCLANYGILEIVGTTKELICIDEAEDVYKKVEVNIYTPNCDIDSLLSTWEDKEKEYKVSKIEKRIKILKAKLQKALCDLENV